MFNKKLIAELNTVVKQKAELDDFFSSLYKHMPTICFEPDGTILDVSELFLETVGYSLSELKGEHHRIFCDADYVRSDEYDVLWQELNSGKKLTALLNEKIKQVKRFG